MELKYFTTLLILITLKDAYSWELSISRKHVHLKPGRSATILCQTDVPLTGCGFKLGDQVYYNLNNGSNSDIIEQAGENGRVLYMLQYSGTGLEHGQCGINLTGVSGDGETYYVGCRARAKTGGWKYKFASVVVHAREECDLKITPQHVVALPGKSVTILCESSHPIRTCKFDLPDVDDTVYFDQGPRSVSTPRYHYHGHGLHRGQCGITLRHVGEPLNGVVWCGGDTRDEDIAQRGATIVVAKAPSEMDLDLKKSSYTLGQKLSASCTVRNSRPVANITWYLGDKMVRRDAVNDAATPDDEWRWPWDLQTITQKLERVASLEDDGKEVQCVVEHVALQGSLKSKQKIRVHAVNRTTTPSTSPTISSRDTSSPVTASSTSPTPTSTPSTPASTPNTSVTLPTDAKCGTRSQAVQIKTHISNGEDASLGEFPWNAGIYRRIMNGSYVLDCGGTLITSQLIVTASHCFWSEVNARKTNSTYSVILGKISRDYATIDADDDDADAVQRFDVVEVMLHPRYRGRKRNYQHDIALVRLGSRASVTHAVNVACVDWSDRFEKGQLAPGVLGSVTGWGYTEEGVVSDTLQYVNLPYVDPIQCYDSLPEDVQPLVTTDKFCAGFVNRNVSVCPGDSGGGLAFHEPVQNKFYLRGVVSLAFRPTGITDTCYSQQVTGFTTMSMYLGWLQPYGIMYP